MDLSVLYTDVIMYHNRATHNKHPLDNPDVKERGYNPSCGDDIMLELEFDGDRIKNAAYTGVGCAISQASTSIMIDLIKGKTKAEAEKLIDLFLGMIKKEVTKEEDLEILEDAMAFSNISNMPARVKCSVLGWHSLREALKHHHVDAEE